MGAVIPLIAVLSALAFAGQDNHSQDPASAPVSTITVTGRVNKPGDYPVFSDGRQITVLAAIDQAGGLAEHAGDDAYILRSSTRPTVRIPVSLSDIRNGKAADVVLQPGDVLTIPEFVPRRRIIFQ